MRRADATAAGRPGAGAQRPPAPARPTSFAAAAALGAAALVALAAAVPAARADLPDHPAIARGPVPAWVAPAGEPRPAPAGASAVAYRLVDDQVLADGDASAVFFQRVLEVVSQPGLQEAAQWEAVFDPGAQRLRVHALEVFRDGAWRDRLASSRASVLQREPELSRRIYDESLTLLLVVEDVRVGDLVRIAYTVEGLNPVLGDRYAGGFAFGWSVPVAEHRLRVLAPAERPVHHRLHGAAAPPPERTVEGGRVALTWRRLDVPAVKPEADLPAGWISFPFVQLSQFASWAEVADWGRALYAPQPPPDELTEVAIEIAGAHPGDAGAQLVAAARWVQDRVRYFAIALGAHSHAPHDLAEIARRRYGDCKDKARLLVGLLGALGIEAWPAFVDADWGDEIASFHPSPFAFEPERLARYARALRSMNDATGYSLQSDLPLERTPAAEDAAAKDPLEPFYMAIGCAVLGGVPLALAVGVVIAIVVVRRQNRRRAAGAAARAAAAPPAACSRCGAVTPPGTRFCAACGASLGPPAARTGGGGIEPVLTAISVVVGGFMLIGFIGIVAALLIPNFIDALGKARQKRTVADLHAIAAGLDAYYASEGRYPEAATAAELAATLTEAGLLTATPVLDGWKHPLGYTCWPGEPGADGCDDYRLASAGADGEFEHDDLADYPGETTERSDFTRDIVRGPEGLIQGPGDG